MEPTALSGVSSAGETHSHIIHNETGTGGELIGADIVPIAPVLQNSGSSSSDTSSGPTLAGAVVRTDGAGNEARLRALHDAVRNGDLDTVRGLLAQGGIDLNRLIDGEAVLHVAATRGDHEILALLLEQKGIDVNLPDANKWAALHIVAKSGNVACLHVLKDAPGIEVNRIGPEGYTPLFVAAKRNRSEFLEALTRIQGIELNKLGPQGSSALHIAAYNGFVESVKVLVNAPGFEDRGSSHGLNALHIVVRCEKTDRRKACLRVLLDTKKIDVNQQTEREGYTPVHAAAHAGDPEGDPECMKLLSGAEGVELNRTCKLGETALDVAIGKRNFAAAAAFLSSPNLKKSDCAKYLYKAVEKRDKKLLNACVAEEGLSRERVMALLRYYLERDFKFSRLALLVEVLQEKALPKETLDPDSLLPKAFNPDEKDFAGRCDYVAMIGDSYIKRIHQNGEANGKDVDTSRLPMNDMDKMAQLMAAMVIATVVRNDLCLDVPEDRGHGQSTSAVDPLTSPECSPLRKLFALILFNAEQHAELREGVRKYIGQMDKIKYYVDIRSRVRGPILPADGGRLPSGTQVLLDSLFGQNWRGS
jgi:ankyrin repeat protein